jgi:hypothetical protein
MNEPFVPLNNNAASGQNRADFRVSILDSAEHLRPFQPLGHAGAKAGAAGQCEPRVTLQRDGERVSAIRIQCSCGQVIDLACVYETVPAGAKS